MSGLYTVIHFMHDWFATQNWVVHVATLQLCDIPVEFKLTAKKVKGIENSWHTCYCTYMYSTWTIHGLHWTNVRTFYIM